MFTCKYPFPIDWETQLQSALMQKTRKRPTKVYICSPCRDRNRNEVWRNMMAARLYMYIVWQKQKYIARATHGYLPMFLNDENPAERMSALGMGQDLLRHSDMLYVCGDRLTGGMIHEIKYAGKCKKPIIVFNKAIFDEVNECLDGIYGAKRKLKHENDDQLRYLALSPAELFKEETDDA